MKLRRIVAIDGPAGSGKSTVGKAVAERLRLSYVATGLMYRALAHIAIERGLDLDDEEQLLAVLQSTEITTSGDSVTVGRQEVGGELLGKEVAAGSSRVAVHPRIRQRMVEMQRALVPEEGAVVEGRDIGTVVFPSAPVKVFLTASAEERALRRARQLDPEAGGHEVVRTLEALSERDRTDSAREASPLAVAEDAVVLDSTLISADGVVEKILELCRQAGIAE